MIAKVYQIDIERDEKHAKFNPIIRNDEVNPEIYEEVFSGYLPVDNLEEVFRALNISPHPLFRGHSLSVSDIVEVCSSYGAEPGFYYCNPVGFEKIDEFDTSKCMRDENLIRIVAIEPGVPAYESYIRNNLEDLQKAVSGMIEFTYPFEDNACIMCNEEGKLRNMEANRRIGNDVYVGNIYIMGANETGENISFTDDQVENYISMFKEPDEISREDISAESGFAVITM